MKIKWNDKRKNGKYYVIPIFADLPEYILREDKGYKPTFTIAPDHHDGLYSMEKLFLEHYTDPTEFSFIQDVFEGDIEHWETVKSSVCIAKRYESWKKKAEAMLISDAMMKIVSTALDENNKNSFQALKYLVERGEKLAKRPTAGRPKKEKKEDEVDSKDLLADIARLRGE